MVADAILFDRDGIYGDGYGPAFSDNAFRFAALSSAALSVGERAWTPDGAVPADAPELPDVVHAHDWHAALAVVYARRTRGAAWARVPLVFTIHNLAYQGAFSPLELDYLGIPHDAWTAGWMRHEGRLNFMKGAIELADRVTTVSQTYAQEIQTPAGGYGLDAHLRWWAPKLVGVVNGIDTESFDPRTDGAIARRYGSDDAAEGKRECKRALCTEMGLDAGGPLIGSVSRLQWQKGLDLLLAVVPALVERGARVALVGSGDPALETALRDAAARFPGRVSARVAFDPLLARRVFAGADFLAVPSRDEPCGLTQMYAMRYGAVPIVTAVGGLRDTVEPLDVERGTGSGIVAASADVPAVFDACERAVRVWSDSASWASLVARAMSRDSSWSRSAEVYMGLYDAIAAQ